MGKKRKDIEDLVYGVMNRLDETGYNTKKYKDLFSKMNDSTFDSYMKKFIKSDENFYLEIVPFKGETLNFDSIKKAADFLKVPLNEYVYMPYANPNGEPIRTQTPAPVGYIHMKRMQQILSKKNSFTTKFESRSAKLGTVTGDDKSGIISDNDNFSLVTIDADYALRELLGPRADDMSMKSEMLKDIERDGYVNFQNLKSDVKNKQAINTLDVYFLGAGVKTDLVSPGLLLQKTVMDKDVKLATVEKYR